LFKTQRLKHKKIVKSYNHAKRIVKLFLHNFKRVSMASLASINIKFTADLKGFSTEMQTALRQIDKAGQKFQEIGRSMSTYVTLPILAAGAAAIKFASDYNESLNKVDVSFKSSSAEVKDFAKTTLESFGIAEGTALDLASTYGDMGTSLGLSTSQAAKMATELVGLAGDLSSFKNISIDVANTGLTGIFTGETESLKKLGIVMTEVTLQQFAYSQGIKTKIQDMDQASKVQLRYNYILSVTKNAQGDFARTQGGAANQMRIFQESLKQLAQQFGSIILPLFTKVISGLNGMITSFGGLSEGTKKTIVIVAAIAAAIGPLLLGLGAIAAAAPFVAAGFAMISASIIPILAGITLLYGAFLILKPAAKEAADSHVQLNDAVKKGNELATGEVTALDKLYKSATNVKLSTDERKKAVDDLQALYPAYFKNIDDEAIKNGTAKKSYDALRDAIFNKSRAAAIDNQLQTNANDRIQKEIDLQDKLVKARAVLNDTQKNAKDTQISTGTGTGDTYFSSRKQQIDAAALSLKNVKSEMAQFTAEALKQDSTLLNAKQEYDSKTGKLKENEIIINGAITNSIGGIVTANENLKVGTVAFYEKQISDLQKIQKETATTEAAYYAFGNAIATIQTKIDALAVGQSDPLGLSAILPPEQVVSIIGGFDNLVIQMQAKAGGLQAVSEQMKATMIDLSSSISSAVTQLATNAASGIGEAIGGLVSGTSSMGDIFTNMLGVIAGFMKSLGESLITAGLAGIAFKKLLANPYAAIVVGVALVALSAVVQSKLSKGPQQTGRYQEGGITGGSSYYGDKILARVNSGELIANSNQQRKIWGAMNSGGDGGFVSSTKIQGSDLLVVIERASARKNRIG
jgi:hypothetical protein